uniref:Transposase n=1 Tax=Globodera rostochiensis TaxID=31243 RepID=A0A914H0G2_GLORO
MEEFWILIFVFFLATNLLDKAESVQLEELPLQTFEELFVEEWLDKDEAEDLKTPAPTNFGQNVHQQIDRQNTQLGQIDPDSTDQLGQIEPNSTDQNPPRTESDFSDNAKNGDDENIAEDERKRQKVSNEKEEHKHLVEKFDQMKAELKRNGFKNSYHQEIDKIVAKELGLSLRTIYNWKRKLGQSEPTHKYTHSEQIELIKRYYEIKDKNSKINDDNIAKMLKIGRATLYKWKIQFNRQQLHSNSVDGYSVEENAAANVQKIENSN